jgi:hypothetical protein
MVKIRLCNVGNSRTYILYSTDRRAATSAYNTRAARMGDVRQMPMRDNLIGIVRSSQAAF